MQRKLRYPSLPLPWHPDEREPEAGAARRRLWWYILGLALLAVFLVSIGLYGGGG